MGEAAVRSLLNVLDGKIPDRSFLVNPEVTAMDSEKH
jgi:hypothetical protein